MTHENTQAQSTESTADVIARLQLLPEIPATRFDPYAQTRLVVTDETANFIAQGYKARVYTGARLTAFVSKHQLQFASREDVGADAPVLLLKADDVFVGIYHHLEIIGISRVITNKVGVGSTRGDGTRPAVEWVIPPESTVVAWWHPKGVADHDFAEVLEVPSDVGRLDGAPC